MFSQPGRACSFCGRDLWDVERFVSAGPLAMCSLCVADAVEVIANASGSEGRELHLPPRVFGEVGTPEDAEAIADAFRAVFTSRSTADSRAPHIDEDEEARSLLTEAHSRAPGRNASARVERIRFIDADTAEVRFQINLGSSPMGPLFEGRSVRKDGRWLVTPDTVFQVTALAGVHGPLGRF